MLVDMSVIRRGLKMCDRILSSLLVLCNAVPYRFADSCSIPSAFFGLLLECSEVEHPGVHLSGGGVLPRGEAFLLLFFFA